MNHTLISAHFRRATLCYFITSMYDSSLDSSTCTRVCESRETQTISRLRRAELCLFTSSVNASRLYMSWVHAQQVAKHERRQSLGAPPARSLVLLHNLNGWLYSWSGQNVQEVQTHKRKRNCGAPPAHRLVLLQTSMDDSILDLSTCPKGCEAQKTPKFWRASGAHTCSASQPWWMTLTLSWLRVQLVTIHKELKKFTRLQRIHLCYFQK